ncbi:MAG: NSS family neurotransmitter:Na+ symporter [Planctomycetota bacterium]|jgi:NSS family neurotransmitter:Na+ symporter
MTEPQVDFKWRSPAAFIIVTVGATLSLNDFLTFPVLAGQNGGGVFLLLYILFLFIMGLPLLMAELLMGRLGGRDPSSCFNEVAARYKASVYWKLVGISTLIAAILIIATLSVVAGWSLAYFFKSVLGVYNGVTPEVADTLFNNFLLDGERMALWFTLFILIVTTICAQPIKLGLERFNLVVVPLMCLLLFICLLPGMISAEFSNSVRFLLYADFSAFDAQTPILALRRAFYTLVIAVGVMMAFGRYIPAGTSIGYSAAMVITIDFLVSIFTGLAINSLVLSAGYQPVLDNQFAFRTLPVIFAQFGLGQWYAAAFYALIGLAATTTVIALMESPINYLMRKYRYSRLKAAIVTAIIIWLFGLGIVLGYSIWSGEGITLALYFGDKAVRLVNNAGFQDVLIFISNYLIQPVAALFICIFVAWIVPREISHGHFSSAGKYRFEVWNFLIRYVTPTLLFIVILSSLGIL